MVQVDALLPMVTELDAPDDAPFPFNVSVFIDKVAGTLVVMVLVPAAMFVVLSPKNVSSLAGSETKTPPDQFPPAVQSKVPDEVRTQV